ncbi:MAG: MalY/PatB family protein [Sulfurospirillum sp.]
MGFFDKEIDRRSTNCEKWNRYKEKDVIPAWVADADFSAPLPVIEALKKRVEHGIFGYTAMDDATVQAVIDFTKRHHNWEIQKEWVVWVNGVVSSMNLVCKMLPSSSSVITTTPIYPHFTKAPKNSNLDTIKVPMREIGDRWSINFEEFEKKISSTCKLFLLCNPYNPGGTVFTKNELEKLGSICKKHDIFICSDEIHADLVINPQAKHIPIASLNEDLKNRTITLMAPSKTFNIAGLQSSFAIIPDKKLRLGFQKQLRGLGGEINLLAITATKAAYSEGDKWLEELKIYLKENLGLVKKFIKKNKSLKMLSCDATYLAWIDCNNLKQKNPYEFFLKFGVGLSEGENFGDKNFIRLNFATSKKNLEEILKRMQEAINSITSQPC